MHANSVKDINQGKIPGKFLLTDEVTDDFKRQMQIGALKAGNLSISQSSIPSALI